MTSPRTVQLALWEVKQLLDIAKRNGTIEFWALVALQWMEGAADEVLRLQEELKAPRDIVLK